MARRSGTAGPVDNTASWEGVEPVRDEQESSPLWPMAVTGQPVDTRSYYREYFGHPVADLKEIIRAQRSSGKRLIFTAGDSSLDNKGAGPVAPPRQRASQLQQRRWP